MDLNNTPAPKSMLLPAGIAFLLLLIVALMALVGCATPTVVTPDPEASAAQVEETQEPPTPVFNPAFGEVKTYDNGVSISVSEPAPFTPTEYSSASANPDVAQWYFFKIVLTNNSAEAIEPFTYESVSSGGVESPSIFDIGNPEVGNVGEAPTTSVQPGQTVEWLVGYGLADPAAITFDIQPGFEYDKTTFTNILP